MLTPLTQSLSSARGLTLPTLLRARGKASGAAAESLASSAQLAIQTLATNAGASDAGVSMAALRALDPAIVTTAKNNAAYVSSASGTRSTYTVTATATATKNTYTIWRAATGAVSRTCRVASLANRGGCPRATTTRSSPAFTW